MSMAFNGSYGRADAASLLPQMPTKENAYGISKPKMSAPVRGGFNMAGLAVCLFGPWILFVVMLTAQSFGLHYQSRFATRALSAGMLLGVIGIGFAAVQMMLKKAKTGNSEPTWYVFLFTACLIAWGSGLAAGQHNYYTNMLPYYDTGNLNTYKSVDPATFGGQQFMDAGRFIFTDDSHLDLTRSMGFKNRDTYCVAPVVSGNGSGMPRFDFWAVGINCCSGHEPDFHCGEFNNPGTRSGLRVMNDAQRPFFRLAVQQAEASYNLRVDHPVFLYWMRDPTVEMNAYQDDGMRFFVGMVFGYLAFQLALTAMGVLILFKSGQLL